MHMIYIHDVRNFIFNFNHNSKLKSINSSEHYIIHTQGYMSVHINYLLYNRLTIFEI